MMGCWNLESISGTCSVNRGGILEAKVFLIEDLQTNHPIIDEANWTITSILTGTASDVVYIDFGRETSTWKYTDAGDGDLKTNITEYNVDFRIDRVQAKKSRALKIMSEGKPYLGIALKLANGSYIYFEYAQLTKVDADGGLKFQDGSKYDISFTGRQFYYPYEISESAWNLLGA